MGDGRYYRVADVVIKVRVGLLNFFYQHCLKRSIYCKVKCLGHVFGLGLGCFFLKRCESVMEMEKMRRESLGLEDRI